MSRLHLWTLTAMILAFIMCLPLRLAVSLIGLEDAGLTARMASGTIWSGRLEQSRLGPFHLGTVDTGLSALPLLLGRAHFVVERAGNDGAGPLAGSLELSSGRRAIDQLSGTIGITGTALGGLPVESVQLDKFSVLFRDGHCRLASGKVQLMLAGRIAGLDLRNGLSGSARCQGRSLVIPLAGQSGMERLTLTIDGTGRYEARFGIAASDPMTATALSAAGFSSTAEGWHRVFRGRF